MAETRWPSRRTVTCGRPSPLAGCSPAPPSGWNGRRFSGEGTTTTRNSDRWGAGAAAGIKGTKGAFITKSISATAAAGKQPAAERPGDGGNGSWRILRQHGGRFGLIRIFHFQEHGHAPVDFVGGR